MKSKASRLVRIAVFVVVAAVGVGLVPLASGSRTAALSPFEKIQAAKARVTTELLQGPDAVAFTQERAAKNVRFRQFWSDSELGQKRASKSSGESLTVLSIQRSRNAPETPEGNRLVNFINELLRPDTVEAFDDCEEFYPVVFGGWGEDSVELRHVLMFECADIEEAYYYADSYDGDDDSLAVYASAEFTGTTSYEEVESEIELGADVLEDHNGYDYDLDDQSVWTSGIFFNFSGWAGGAEFEGISCTNTIDILDWIRDESIGAATSWWTHMIALTKAVASNPAIATTGLGPFIRTAGRSQVVTSAIVMDYTYWWYMADYILTCFYGTSAPLMHQDGDLNNRDLPARRAMAPFLARPSLTAL